MGGTVRSWVREEQNLIGKSDNSLVSSSVTNAELVFQAQHYPKMRSKEVPTYRKIHCQRLLNTKTTSRTPVDFFSNGNV